MANLLHDDTNGAVYDGTQHNANNTLLEATFGDLGPYVITGLVPSIGTGLAVAVTAGTAVIGGHVSVSSGFNITGLSPSTTNHLFLLQAGTGTANTTGTPPVNSVKLGTAVTGVATVTSVNVLRSSGRQALVRPESQVPGAVGSPGSYDLSQWAASAADSVQFFGVLPSGAVPAITTPLTLTNDDATGSGVTFPLRLRHTNSGGAGANGIGTGLQWEAENTGGTVSTIGAVRMLTENAISANLTSRWEVEVYQNGAARTIMRAGPTSVRFEQQPAASADFGLVSIGGGGWAGGAGNFVGSANGTLLALNMDAVWAGDWCNFQEDSVEYFRIGATGTTIHSIWNSTNNAVSTALTLRHLSNAGAAAANIGTRLEFQAESDSGDVANIAAQIDAVLTTITAGAATGRMDLRVNSAGTVVTPFSVAPTAVSLGEAINLAVGTTTGSKIGTSSSQKLGFFGVTPVVQPAANADTSGATLAQVETEVNEIKALLRSVGLMAP